ncbi:hypothetical protein [Nocardia sp. MW-W600-9]
MNHSDVLHRDPQRAVDEAAIVHSHHVRVIDPGRQFGLPDEHGPEFRCTAVGFAQNLDRAQARMTRSLAPVQHSAGIAHGGPAGGVVATVTVLPGPFRQRSESVAAEAGPHPEVMFERL